MENQNKIKILILDDEKHLFEGIVLHQNEIAIDINLSFAQMFGYTREEVIGKNVVKLIVKEEYHALISQNIIKNYALPYEVVGLRKDGTELPIEIEARDIESDGKTIRVVAVRVISERKKFEKELQKQNKELAIAKEKTKESENKHLLLLQHLHAGVVVHATDSSILFANDQASELLGLTYDQLKGKTGIGPTWNFISEEKTPIPIDQYPVQFVITQKKPLRDTVFGINRSETKDLVWVLVNAFPEFETDGSVAKVVVTFVDITKRKQAEEEMKSQKERLNNIIESTNLGTWEWNVQTGETIFNEKWANLIGYTLEEISPVSIETWMKFAHPDDLEESGILLNKHFMSEIDYYYFESRIKHKNLGWIWVLDRGKVVSWTEDGKPEWMCGTHQDISKRKELEEKLTSSERRLSAFSNVIGEAVFFSDKGICIETNESAIKMFGYSYDEIIGKIGTYFIAPESKELVKNNMLSGYAKPYDALAIKKDGSKFWCELSGRNFNYKDKDIRVTSLIDISVRKQHEKELKIANEKLKESEEIFRRLFNDLGDAVFVAKIGGTDSAQILNVNPAAEKQTGYTRDDLLKMNIARDLHIADSSETPPDEWDKALLKGQKLISVEKKRKKDGTEYWAEVVITPIDFNGEKACLSVNRDITERKKVEKEKEKLLYQLSERIKELNCFYDIAQIIEKYGNNIDKIFEETAQILRSAWQYPNITCTRIISGIIEYKTDNFLETKWKQSSDIKVNGEITGEVVVCYLEEKPESDEGPFLKEEKNLIVSVSEQLGRICERKQAEQKLIEAREYLNSIIDHIADPVYVKDDQSRLRLVNNSFCKLFDLSRDAIIGKTLAEGVTPEEQEDFLKIDRDVLDSGKDNLNEETITVRGGQTRILSTKKSRFIDKMGEKYLIGVSHDITERKLAEEVLKVSEEKYKTMLNACPNGIMIINKKGIIVEVSEIGIELLGFENRDELIGKHFFKYVPTDEKIIIEEAIQKTLNEGIEQNVELKIRKKNQSLFLSEISLTLIQSTETALFSFMITIRDISQRKKMEKKQIHADRMSSLGEMASGIAHEINQPLNTLSLVVDNILYEAAKDENIGKEYLKKKTAKIFTNITRIKNIIDHIRAFSRTNDNYVMTGFDINLSINNAVNMISKQLEHLDISLDIQLEGNPPLIIGNTYQFEQVIINMLSNAKDALLEKKKIRKAPFGMLVGIRSFKDNQSFIIEITDNGIGISDEDMENIILPFYTTKDTGKGTGLGLSISFQIIKEMDGAIEISSNKHTGTTFKIILMLQNKE